ncbi:MAG: hypothetical protein CMH57_03055 [Myxococcales bacterium]|nr:hypothetical protein [Myxococcales bacterium]
MGDGPRVVIYYDVLEELLFYARYRSEDTATVLIGGYHEGDDGPFIEIQGYTSASWVETRRDWLHMLHKRLLGVVDGLRADGDEQRVVGWSMARRGGAARLDVEDLMVHLSFFNLPHQGILAIDLDADALAFYQRTPAGVLINVGFEVVSLRRREDEGEPLFDVEVVSDVIEEYLEPEDAMDETVAPRAGRDGAPTSATRSVGGEHAEDS